MGVCVGMGDVVGCVFGNRGDWYVGVVCGYWYWGCVVDGYMRVVVGGNMWFVFWDCCGFVVLVWD